jgi:hypothetical protein
VRVILAAEGSSRDLQGAPHSTRMKHSVRRSQPSVVYQPAIPHRVSAQPLHVVFAQQHAHVPILDAPLRPSARQECLHTV